MIGRALYLHLLTTEEVINHLDISKRTVQRWRQAGRTDCESTSTFIRPNELRGLTHVHDDL